MQRFSLVLVVLAVLGLFAVASVSYAADTEEGTFVKADDSSITISQDGKDKTFDMAKDAKIQCDSKDCKVSELKAKAKVKLTVENKKVTKVDATSPK